LAFVPRSVDSIAEKWPFFRESALRTDPGRSTRIVRSLIRRLHQFRFRPPQVLRLHVTAMRSGRYRADEWWVLCPQAIIDHMADTEGPAYIRSQKPGTQHPVRFAQRGESQVRITPRAPLTTPALHGIAIQGGDKGATRQGGSIESGWREFDGY
jgi:hypothetical protein